MLNEGKFRNKFFYSKSSNNSHKYLSNFAIQSKNLKNSFFKESRKELGIIDFIKEKKKFFMPDFFDEKNTKKFLCSKEKAMMEIKLNEDLLISNNGNEFDIEINKRKAKNKIRHESASPRKERNKSKKTKITKNINKFKSIEDKITLKNNNKKISENNKSNSNDSKENYIYKYIIDNADDSEDNFFNNLKKEIKKVENKKENIKNKDDNIYRTFSTKKSRKSKNLKINNNIDKKRNSFKFNENIKYLMVNDELELSSINNDDSFEQDKNPKKTFGTCCMKNKKDIVKNSLFGEKKIVEKNIVNEYIEIDSPQQSLISILSDLM